MSRRSQRTISVLVPPNLIPLAPEDPRTIGPYTVIGRIGSGRTGTVYAAVNPAVTSDAVLAVKTLHPSHLTDEATLVELEGRLRALAEVDGRCYVPPVAFDARATPPWLAMPYTSGVPLAQYVRKRGPLGEGRLVALAAGLAEGLSALHGAGLAHGDLKPSNILLGSSGPRLLDCALPGDATMLRSSAAWLAPERHLGDPPSPAADVFGWGCVVVFAATGRSPFGMGLPEEVVPRIAEGAPDLAGVPAVLEPLLRRTLEEDPRRRPSLREIMGATIAVWEASTAALHPEVPGTAVTQLLTHEWQGILEPAGLPRVVHLDGAARSGRGRGLLLGGAAALVLALAGVGTWAVVSATSDAPQAAPSARPSLPSSPTPAEPVSEGPDTAVVRFGAVPQPSPFEGPWVYTEVEPVEDAAPSPSTDDGRPPTPQEWSARWRDVDEVAEARIAPDAEVRCARFCMIPGQVSVDDEGHGTYPVTGQDLIDYLGWGDVVIAEVTFADEEGEDGLPEIVAVTELLPPSSG